MYIGRLIKVRVENPKELQLKGCLGAEECSPICMTNDLMRRNEYSTHKRYFGNFFFYIINL
jgi:hypothetical protein